MKFQFAIFHKTSIHIAVEKENIEIIKLLLANQSIDVNILNILMKIIILCYSIIICLIKFRIKLCFNGISDFSF